MTPDLQRIAIAGASTCGKTTLAIHLSRAYWSVHKMPSLVLDPFKSENAWGPQAWVTERDDKFWGVWNEDTREFDGGAIWNYKTPALVIVDESSTTIRRDRALVPMFTRIRHHKHSLLVICHDATDLLPTMRRNLTQLYLFPQSVKAMQLWIEDLPRMYGIDIAATEPGERSRLNDYEFIHCKNGGEAAIRKLKL